jgi:two-component system, OmpR family, heavy metal sensor histidine kinase CusS
MTIRTRLTLWYAGVMFVSLLLMGVFTWRTFAPEPHATPLRPEEQRQELDDATDFREVALILIWCGVPAALLAAIGGWWLMRRALAPVAALTRAAERVNERNLSAQLPRSGSGDEVDRLTEVFNAMTARLHASFTRIREFTLHASHELKTPLTVLCGETETALRDESLAPAQRERAASQLEEFRRLASIVDGLTLLAKADAGLVQLTFAPLRLDELVRDSFADAQILGQASGLHAELTACEPLTVSGDAHRLRQLLLNLADNAAKHNQPGGSVRMALRQSNGSAELVIANTGPGISPEKLPRVFDRFFRGDPAHGSTAEGCGLGLSIAQWIVSAHHGDIRIDSVPSKLTTVTVHLPLWAENKDA